MQFKTSSNQATQEVSKAQNIMELGMAGVSVAQSFKEKKVNWMKLKKALFDLYQKWR